MSGAAGKQPKEYIDLAITGCGGGGVRGVRGVAIPRHGSEWVATLIDRLQATVPGLCPAPKEPPHQWPAHSPGNSADTHTILPGGALMAVLWQYFE